MARPFAKYEGLGNDFVVLDVEDEAPFVPETVRAVCDRRRGIGADGILLVLPARNPVHAVARMKVLSADGSVPEMCGNGLRCVAVHVARAKNLESAEFTVETDAGLRTCTVDDRDARGMVTVDMGLVRAEGPRPLEVDGERLPVWIGDAGNPHAVLFGDASLARAEQLGPRIEKLPAFPRGTNVELASVNASRGEVSLVVWERGVGITLACGTGACATVAAACEAGLLPFGRATTVHLPGGALEVNVAKGGKTTMRGPARLVFRGTLLG